jgi:predicted AAA+ superfamily ATPase
VILRQLIAALVKKGVPPRNIFYLDKERLEYSDLVDHKQLHDLIQMYRKRLRVKGRVYLFLDEIQEIEGWERLVNAYSQDPRHAYELFVTGSNSNLLSSELGTLLTGRYVPFTIFPFSFEEYSEARGLPKNKATVLSYLQLGGLPELIHLESEEARRHYVTALRDAILLNDIVRRHGVKDVDLLNRLFRYLCENAGTLVSANKLVDFLRTKGQKTNFETVSNYFSYLCEAMLVHECDRYDIRGKELLAGNRKYYLNDLAYRQYLTSGFEAALPQRIENLVYLHYRSQGYAVHVGASQHLEVDFVLEKEGRRSYCQVCYLLSDEKVVEREFRSLERIRDNFPKTVISMDDVELGARNGITHELLWNVL